MFCQHCGQPLNENAALCAQCGKPLQPAGTPVPPATPFALPERRINTLAWGWFVYAALEAFFSLIRFLIVHTFAGMHFNDGFGIPLGHHLTEFLLRIVWVVIGVRIALALLAGFGLLHKAPWGRALALFASFITVIHPILGTAMGIWSLIVLLNRENAAALDAMS